MLSKFGTLLASASLAACSVVGIREAEEPRFTVVDHIGAVEVRQYAPRIAAETAVDGDEMAARSAGFRRLAGYIFGNNRSQAKIAMTAPVGQSAEKIAMTAPVAQARDTAGRWVIRFYMPSSYILATLPKPVDPAVHLTEVPEQVFAVLRFSGSISPGAMSARQQELARIVAASPWRAIGAGLSWFYDPPWTLPPLRRNEVAVPVERR